MKHLVFGLILLSALALLMAVIGVLFSGGFFLGLGAETLSRASNNIALIAIALVLWMNFSEKKFKVLKKRLQAIEALRKSEERIKEKQGKIIRRGLKRKLATPPSSIKKFEDCFGRIFKTHYF